MLLDQFMDHEIVVDMQSQFVYVGKLTGADELYLELTNADAHDLRDSNTNRERYVIESKMLGVRANRQRVLVARNQVVGLSLLADVIE